MHAALAITRASRVIMCPTYYSDDRMLDVVFGQRQSGYLDELGRKLDPHVGVYWAGEEICAREFSPGHLARVAESLRRKPTLWDNDPVNDGLSMSCFTHLRGFTGRPGAIGAHVAAHALAREELASMLEEDLHALQDLGLNRLSDERQAALALPRREPFDGRRSGALAGRCHGGQLGRRGLMAKPDRYASKNNNPWRPPCFDFDLH